MKKVSKLLIMAIVVLAVITMSLNVNASTQILKDYVGDIHNINGMVFELTDSQKTAVLNYISTLDDATAATVHNEIVAVENLVRSTGATQVSQISVSTRNDIIARAKSVAAKAGLTLTVDTKANSFTLTKSNGEVLTSGSYVSLIKYQGSAPAGATAGATTTTKLLYTGANYAVYAVAVIAIVAVAIVVKKRA